MTVLLLQEDSDLEDHLIEREKDGFSAVVGRGIASAATGIVLVSFGDGFAYLGRFDKFRPNVTAKDGVRCSSLVRIEPQLTARELTAAMPPASRRYVQLGTLPPQTGESALEALVTLRPELEADIQRLLGDAIPGPPSDGAATAALEKDAVGLALQIFDGDRSPITKVKDDFRRDEPFLSGLRDVVLREDPMVWHDTGVFGDWNVVQRAATGMVRFTKGSRSLTVLNVNRAPIENVLGVDLVYYNEYFHAFVLVQYKRMEHQGVAGWGYRPDKNHNVEAERMETVPAQPADPADALSYRLNAGACFFKLCEREVIDPSANALIPGLYLPFEYMSLAAPGAKGPLGGPFIGYSTVERHLTNTDFTRLVQDGWVGSAGEVSDTIHDYVEARVKGGASVMLAFATGKNGPARRR